MEKQNRIFGLDLIRFLAISSVLYCHFSGIFYPFFSGKGEIFFNLSNWITGYYGVELFFVLSGFLIGSIYIKTIVNNPQPQGTLWHQINDFWLRRWIRTLPNYYLFILINIIVCVLVSYKIDTIGLLKALFFLQKIQILSPVTFFGVSWSLAIEEWFYFLMPLFFLIAFFFSKNKKVSFGVAIACLLIIPIVNKVIYAFQHINSATRHDEVYRYATFYRIDAIGFGVLFSWLWMNNDIKAYLTKHQKGLLALGMFLLLCSFAYIYLFLAKMEQNPLLFAALSTICCIAILFCFPATIHLQVKPNTFFYRTVVLISLSSYSLYLCHGSVLQLSDYFLADRLNLKNILVAAFYAITLLTSAIFIAHLNYKYFEKPILNKRDNIIKFLKRS